MRVVGYTRISDADQSTYSLDSQREIIERYCERMGAELVRVFVDDGVSAKTINRPALQELMKWATLKKNRVDLVVVWKWDRLARETGGSAHVRNFLRRKGVQV